MLEGIVDHEPTAPQYGTAFTPACGHIDHLKGMYVVTRGGAAGMVDQVHLEVTRGALTQGMRLMGIPLVNGLGLEGGLRGRRRVSGRDRERMRRTVETLIRSSWWRSWGERWSSPWASSCWAVETRLGVRRSAQM